MATQKKENVIYLVPMAKEPTPKNPKGTKKTSSRPSTQAHLPIAEIKDGTVVLKDGTLRSVLMVSSINFALKSEDEQNALISGYVGFLNGLDFPIQIVVQSRRLNIQGYLDQLYQQEQAQPNELLRVQIADYRAFIKELVDIGQIMTKRFYVVVPMNPLGDKKEGFFTRLKEIFRPASTIKLKDKDFQKRKENLDLRVRQVQQGLNSMSLNAIRLDTQALIELYYNTYNPDTAFSEELSPITDIQVDTHL